MLTSFPEVRNIPEFERICQLYLHYSSAFCFVKTCLNFPSAYFCTKLCNTPSHRFCYLPVFGIALNDFLFTNDPKH